MDLRFPGRYPVRGFNIPVDDVVINENVYYSRIYNIILYIDNATTMIGMIIISLMNYILTTEIKN